MSSTTPMSLDATPNFSTTTSITKDDGTTITSTTSPISSEDSSYQQILANTNIIQGTDEDTDGKNLHKLMNANGIFRPSDYDDIHSFYIFPRNDPYKMLGTTREYLFITKPDLHIFGTKSADSSSGESSITDDSMTELNPELNGVVFFNDLHLRGYDNTVLQNLQLSANRAYPFINLFSNYKTSNIDLSDISVDDIETSSNIYNTKLFYRKPSDSADENNEFSIEFKDNKYLDCYLWFKAYDLYEQRKYHGLVTPTDDRYIVNKVLSDQMTAFKIVVGEDGESIIYWAQIWGCYPKTVPRTTFSDMPTDGNLKFSVNWKATFQQDLDPISIVHFNKLCRNMITGSFEYISLYDNDIGRVTQEKAAFPYIVSTLDAVSKGNNGDSVEQQLVANELYTTQNGQSTEQRIKSYTHYPYKLKWYRTV